MYFPLVLSQQLNNLPSLYSAVHLTGVQSQWLNVGMTIFICGDEREVGDKKCWTAGPPGGEDTI